MTDTLIARLRNGNLFADRVEAADLIEALHAELKNEQRKVTELVNGYEADQEEIRKLRAELGQYPEIQAMLMKENKELHAEVESLRDDNARLQRDLEFAVGVEPNVGRPKLSLDRQEPVWYYKLGKHGEHRFYDLTETQPEGCIPLYLAAGAAPTKEQT